MTEQPRTSGAVFLSYASQDAEAAERLCEALRTAGIEVWLDKNELRGGDAWDAQIKRRIHDCALFIPLISAHTNARAEGYFRREWKQATRRLQDMADDVAFLVPVAIDETREADARVPEEFLHAQWTRLPGGETPPAFAQRVRHLLGADILTEQAAKSAGLEPNARGAYSRNGRALSVRLVGLALIALIVLGGGAFLYYQGARDTPVASPTAITASPVVAAAPHERSIAVLPFVNMSSDKEQEYFSDGISEELLNLLAKIPELKVIARTSSFSFKGQNIDIAEIAKKLGVANVLEGSVRKSGKKLRITAQLIRTADSTHLWSETYDREMSDIFAVQDEIAGEVVDKLKITLLGAAPKAKAVDPEAYTLFLQARDIARQYTASAYENAIVLLQRAIELDDAYAAPWAALADIYFFQVIDRVRPLDENMELARAAIDAALRIDPNNALAHIGLANIVIGYDRDLGAGARHLEHALKLEPANLDVIGMAAFLARRLGRLEQAIALGEFQVARDPANSGAHGELARAFMVAGRFDESVAEFRTALRLNPSFPWGHGSIGEVLLLKGNARAALAEAQQEVDPIFRLAVVAMANHALGQKAASDAALRTLIDKYGARSALDIATVLAYRGERDRAFEWLDNAFEYHDLLLNSAAAHPTLANLHEDPRWLPFLRKINMAPEQLAAIKFEVKLPQ
jgi:TolB-like protein/cytochrome c-type biogenesis protein CcmH/NrfG